MGIYYAVVNRAKKQYLYPDCQCGVRIPAIFSRYNSLSQLVLYKIFTDWNQDPLEIWADSDEWPWWNEKGWKDITRQTRKEILKEYGHYDDVFDNLLECENEYKEFKKKQKEKKMEKIICSNCHNEIGIGEEPVLMNIISKGNSKEYRHIEKKDCVKKED